MTDDPLVIVIPDKDKVKGLDTLDDLDQVPRFKAVPLSDALTANYPYFAHFFLYQVEGELGWCRFNKPSLPELRDAGRSITLSVSVTDWDTGEGEDHVPLDHAGYLAIRQDILQAATTQNLPAPTLIYKTRAGLRCLWTHPPLSPERAEAFTRWLIASYMKAGVTFDTRCWQWNRPYALPYVTRDGVPLDPDPLAGEPLDAIPDDCEDPGYSLACHLDASQLRADAPSPDAAMALVWRDGSPKLTPWGAKAVRRMRGRDAEVCFDYKEPPRITDASRNETLFKWIASLVSMLHKNPEDTTPEHVWGVVLPAAQVNTRQDSRNLYAECWKMVCYCWAHEQAQVAVTKENTTTFMSALRAGVLRWWPQAPEDEEELGQALRKKVILVHQHDYYTLTETGLYTPTPVKQPAVIAALRHSGLVGKDRLLYALESQGPKGPQALTGQRAIDVFASPIQTVEITGGPTIGGYLREDGTLVVSRYARRDLPPERSALVDAWLQAAFGIYYSTVVQWIAAALAFDRGPVAALSILGPPSIGKDLLASILARTVSSCMLAGPGIFDDYQYFVDRTPYVWINEQNPPQASGYDGRFRELVGGQWLEINQKHQAHVRMKANLRILMTANSDVLIKKLYARRGMSQDEREATGLRVIHLDLKGYKKGAEFLQSLKDEDTSIFGRWVEGDEGARHFLWIHQNEKLPKPGRFLLDGQVVQEMEWEDGDVTEVGEVLVTMVAKNRDHEGLVSAADVMGFMDEFMDGNRFKNYNLVKVGKVLGYWCGPRRRQGRRRIDLGKLKEFARAQGLVCDRLKEVKA